MLRPKQFIPESPFIICAFEEIPIGTIENRIYGDRWSRDANVPHVIKRQATFEEYLETVKPEHRDWVKNMADPDARFYEVEIRVN